MEFFLSVIICFLNMIFRKFDKIYLFSGFLYPDNIQAIFDELIKNNSDSSFKIICDGPGFAPYFANGKTYKNVKFVSHESVLAIFEFITSKYIIFDNGIFGQKKPHKNQIFVNTWHGTSLKKIGYYLGESNSEHFAQVTYAVAYSELFADVISYAFGITKDDVLISGEPRNDYFFSEGKEKILDKLNIKKTYNKIIIWMPTYRRNPDGDSVDGADSDYGIPIINKSNINDLDNICDENNILLIIKWHGLQKLDDLKNARFKNIRVISSEDIQDTGMPLYFLVGCCDALITDYSSIYVNYLVLNRPICFAYDDMEVYQKNRGFMFENVKDIMPGDHVNTFNQLVRFISNIANDIDEYNDIRNSVSPKLNKYSDNKNSKRLLKYLDIIK